MRETKKPPGGPGGFFGSDGDDASRRDQRHEPIMHSGRCGTMSDTTLLRLRVKPSRMRDFRDQAAFFSSLTAFRTSSTWPGTFRPRHSCFSMPSAPTRKVLRSMPLTFLPYMILFFTTPNMWHIFSSVSAISSKGSSSLVLNSSCDFMLSRDTPNTTAPAFTKSLYLSRNCMASVVQPGVLSFG